MQVVHYNSEHSNKTKGMKLSVCVFSSAAILLTVSGCSLLQKSSAPAQAEPTPVVGVVKTQTVEQTEGTIHKVFYGEWMASRVGELTITGDNRPYIVFDADPTNPFLVKCYANNGCNTINGEFAITPGGNMKPTTELISTMMLCPDAPYEMGFSTALNTVASYSIEKIGSDYLLYLKNEAGETTMILRKSDLDFANGAWSVQKINDAHAPQEAEMRLVIDIPELKIHGNAGCNVLNGKISINPDVQNSLSFSDLITTRMSCPYLEAEQSLIQALESAKTVATTGNKDVIYFADAAGKTVLVLKRLNLKK